MKVEKNEADYKDSEGSYIDPDSVSDVNKSNFYNHLTCFLNHQEEKYKKSYLFLPPSKAPMTTSEKIDDDMYDKLDEKKIVVTQSRKVLFRLTSDQFGFSATETKYNDNRYPLTNLLRLYQNSEPEERDKVKKRITQYVKNTRTIGGSFLWPVPPKGKRNCNYNQQRGVRNYLEDRVDLTLLEIKHALEGRYDNGEYASDMLYNQYRSEKTHIKTWLEHFGTFPEYVEYFMLEPFIAEDGWPINIVNGEPLNDNYIENYREHRLQDLSAEKLCDMLKRLECMILNRSKKMENVIK